MSFETFIAKRYFQFSGNRPPLLTFLIRISLFSIAVSVFALVFILSVMEGFERDFQKRILGFRAPLLVVALSPYNTVEMDTLREKIQRIPRVLKVLPFVEGETIIQADNGMTMGMRLRGISEKPDPQRLGELSENREFASGSLILGDELAGMLRVHPDFNETMQLVFPLGEIGPTGDLIPHRREVRLTGLFHSGYYDFDHKYGLVSYEEARKLFGAEGKRGLEVWFHDIHDTERMKRAITSQASISDPPSFAIETWVDQNPKLFAALRLEKIGMGALLAVLLWVASFNIFSVLSLTVVEKRKDMGLLKALGLQRKAIRKIFLFYALRLAAWGGGVGGLLGLSCVLWGVRHPIDLPPTYYIDKLPLSFSPLSLSMIFFLVPVIVLLAAFYPAYKACEADPIASLQREES